jgi:HSP20 family molecular chaperone IbpA
MDIVQRSRYRALLAASVDTCASCWRPAVDVYREPGGWLCKFALPGVAREDVEVRLSGAKLLVTGVRRDRTLTTGCEAYSLEIEYHAFERTIELPADLRESSVQCVFDDGMLCVRITERRS